LKGIFGIIAVLGLISMAFANIGSIGYGLYLWGGTGMAFGAAAWAAFKIWMIAMVVGIVVFIGAGSQA